MKGPGSASEHDTPRADERGKTDQSLRNEREKSVELVADARVALEQGADELVEHARERADTVLETARGIADDNLEHNPSVPGDAVARERALADHVLKNERAAADEILRREREEQAAVAAALLLEREKTDRYLLSERARSDDALAHRDDFLGMVSHDLRNLLNGIGLHAALLSAKASDSEEGRRTREATGRIQGYLHRMGRLIADLSDVASIDAGKFAVQRKSGDAAMLVAEALEVFLLPAQEKRISLTARTPATLPCEFDRQRLLQVLTNLLSNSLKFTARGGAIVVSAEQVGNEIQFCVRDTGIGIPADMLEAVFERFWQVGKNDQRGLGLGLHISRCIVEAHGGSIRADSKLGEGSAFTFTIGACAAAR